MTDFQPIQLTAAPPADPTDSEDTARADLYGLLATLFYRAPDAALLHHIAANRAVGEDAQTVLGKAWNALCDAACETTAAEAEEEYRQLFVGVGRQDVFLYGSFYMTGFLNERPLVALREDLARYGLERHEGVSETEDHIATLCEVMRFLVAGDDLSVSNLGEQQRFYAKHLQPWIEPLCEAVAAHPQARFYRSVAGLLGTFAGVEAVALEMT
ncbi:chaperone; signal peptide and TAT signal protection of TorA precursor [Cupriavidus phytorum]|uniref:Chaperone signal peptide and TAT signal protection of TorA n=2 Tax=Cupriavidus TaxID=106589 RepID=A0A375BZ64_9BURK|nr:MULTISPECIES: molecular chaperone TorD family protein [Cupriavidus]PZX29349.1 Tat proofreading chaperone TorD [Cupriavidus alkaliphilus]SOY59004.1 chaperone; signal peptide and TAT signal protection of TorA precursor [Cupriavidus taiwanensis]